MNYYNKKALHPFERTKSERALVVPPLFAHASRHRPQLQDILAIYDVHCTSPLTEASRPSFTFVITISSRSIRDLFHGVYMQAFTSRSLSECTTTPLLVPSQLFFI